MTENNTQTKHGARRVLTAHETERTIEAIIVARAACPWEDIQQEEEIAPGVYWFCCAGHGGAIAVLSAATHLSTEGLQAARERGLITEVEVQHGAGRRCFEAWVGEEDVEWATLALASTAICDGLARRTTKPLTADQVRALALKTCQRWNERFLVALDPAYQPHPDGQITREDRRAALLAGGEYLCVCAAQRGDQVQVTFRNQVRDKRVFAMSADTYDAIELVCEATPTTFAAVGAITELTATTD